MTTDACQSPAIQEQRSALLRTREPHIEADHRIPALDGIRGLALLLVVGHHFVQVLPMRPRDPIHWWRPIAHFFDDWGWIGVDLFFVLSGYLITGILLESKAAPNYFRNFYARRVLRIFPAYYALLLFFLGIFPAVAHGFVTATRWGMPLDQWTYWAYLANLSPLLHTHDYHPLGHTWSLAVEEQFYIAWPAVIFWVRKQWVSTVCLAVIAAAIILRAVLFRVGYSQYDVSRITVTRVDALAMGALLAALYRSPSARPHLHLGSWIALFFALAALMFLAHFGSLLPMRGSDVRVSAGFVFIALLGAGLVGVATTAPMSNWINRALSFGVLCWCGRLSYGLYLYHYPILLIVYHYMGSFDSAYGLLMRFAVFPAATIGAALLSWYLLERPVLRLKRHFPTRVPQRIVPCQS